VSASHSTVTGERASCYSTFGFDRLSRDDAPRQNIPPHSAEISRGRFDDVAGHNCCGRE